MEVIVDYNIARAYRASIELRVRFRATLLYRLPDEMFLAGLTELLSAVDFCTYEQKARFRELLTNDLEDLPAEDESLEVQLDALLSMRAIQASFMTMMFGNRQRVLFKNECVALFDYLRKHPEIDVKFASQLAMW